MITEHQHIYSRRQGSGAHLAAARCQHLLLEATIGRKVDEALVIRSSSGSAICGVSHVGVAAAHLESRCCRWVSLCARRGKTVGARKQQRGNMHTTGRQPWQWSMVDRRLPERDPHSRVTNASRCTRCQCGKLLGFAARRYRTTRDAQPGLTDVMSSHQP
jgi:hypothetical protein